MRNRLRVPFVKAIHLATASIEDVAKGIDRGRRTVTAYLGGERRVTPDAAQALAAYLRGRARAFNEAADRIEAAAEKEERSHET